MHTHLKPSSEGANCPACSRSKLVRIDTAFTRSRSGEPMAVVACPSCNWREGWIKNSLSGQMAMIWSRQGSQDTSRSVVELLATSSPYARV
jgi:hypothetical protein